MIRGTHDSTLVVLSILIAAAASYTALDLAGRIRACRSWHCYRWLTTAAVAMGGGVWSMHFVAMLAFSMPGMEVGYDLGLTLLSLVLPIIVTGVAFYVVSRESAGWVALCCSGLFMGLGIVAMHYTGMAAMRMGADLRYQHLWVAVSVLIAIGASTLALWIAFKNAGFVKKLAAAICMGLAISGMHYAAMQGAIFTGNAVDHAHGYASIGQLNLALLVASTMFFVLFIALSAAMVDRRFAALAEQEAESLRRSEERFRLIIQSVTDYAIFLLDAEGHVSSWNKGAERIKGYIDQEIIGAHLSRFYTAEDREAALPTIALDTARRAGKFEAEGWRVRKDGSRFWASEVIDAIRDEAGRAIGFVKVTRDITERKHAQEALEKTQRALFQAQKMEALGLLTGGIAHDFNNLLTIIVGSLALLRKRLPPDERSERLLNNAVESAERGATLTQRMLAFARRQDLNLTTFYISDLIKNMEELLYRSAGPEITLQVAVPSQLPPVLADYNQLELALLNLVVNARDATPHGGAIAISARLPHGDDQETMLSEYAQYVVVSVSDSGQGMDQETLARATEPFFTTKGVGKGTGLGLSMVHGFAEQSKGRLLLKSKTGEGTTAEIWLPAHHVDQAPEAPEIHCASARLMSGAV